jgi:hypothetical protein
VDKKTLTAGFSLGLIVASLFFAAFLLSQRGNSAQQIEQTQKPVQAPQELWKFKVSGSNRELPVFSSR